LIVDAANHGYPDAAQEPVSAAAYQPSSGHRDLFSQPYQCQEQRQLTLKHSMQMTGAGHQQLRQFAELMQMQQQQHSSDATITNGSFTGHSFGARAETGYRFAPARNVRRSALRS
jgi:hypothetical protein